MGTRSLIFVYENRNGKDKPILNLYQQYDGYISGVGYDLAKFLAPLTVVNGFGRAANNIANGMGCFAAQLVSYFKTGVGGAYVYSVDSTDCGQDYEYHVYSDRVVAKEYDGRVLFDGSWKDFLTFCEGEYSRLVKGAA
jgi:hypothetical protein